MTAIEEVKTINEIKPEFEIKIGANNLSVYVKLAENGVSSDVVIQVADIIDVLEKRGIKYGVMEDDIKEFCAKKDYFKWHSIALGTHSVDGENGSFKLTFNPDRAGPHERDDGTIDFKELDLVKNVYEGEVLCNITLPTAGYDGTNVFGTVIPAKNGVAAKIEPGKFVVRTDDGTELRAEKDGCVFFKSGKVYVEDVYNIKDDVSLKTGNIKFNGSVFISESVLQGFSVVAGNDIYVKGRVEGAVLKAGGDITIAGGISGMNVAMIEAGGNITAKFIENANVICGGDIICDIVLMSNIKAERSIFMKGKKSSIIGGTTLAGEQIVAKNLGSNKYPKQEVAIRKNWKLYENHGASENDENAKANKVCLEKQKREMTQKLAKAEELIKVFQVKISEEEALGPNKNVAVIKDCMIKKSEFTAVATSLKALIERFKEEDVIAGITCKGTVYPGVRLRIDNCLMNVETEIQNQKFYECDGEIVAGAALPGESGS